MDNRGSPENPFHFLLVEDNPGDADLVKEALKTSPWSYTIFVVTDGEAALAYLNGDWHFTDVLSPDLILLDLNLPIMDGREVLGQLKQYELLRQIPVVVLSSSEAERDLSMAYLLHANCFVTKPVDLDEYFEKIRAITQFWLVTAKLPPRLRRVELGAELG